MPRFCIACGAQVGDTSAFCPGCGKAQPANQGVGAAPAAAAGGLPDNLAGMLAYITFIPAIIFLAMEPYNRSRFVRFHAFQSIFFAIAWTALYVALGVVSAIPVLGALTFVLWPLASLAAFIIWVVLLLKANQGQMFKLPVIGDMAEKQAGA